MPEQVNFFVHEIKTLARYIYHIINKYYWYLLIGGQLADFSVGLGVSNVSTIATIATICHKI